MLFLRQIPNGARKGVPTVNSYAALLLANPEMFELGNEHNRSEGMSSKPGIGSKVRSVLEGIRNRVAVNADEGLGTPALLDYPYRS
jgi:hypothetical protein